MIGKYKKFHAAPTKEKGSSAMPVEKWHGVIELEFEADSKLDADELYDLLWKMCQHKQGVVGAFADSVEIPVPVGVQFKSARLPADAIFLPED